MGLLEVHMNRVEEALLSISKIPANSGHSLHKGTPREAFVRQYLEQHLSQDLAIGTGEVIDATSQPNEPRNQIDIVLYRRGYPRLSFGGNVYGYLAESVVATLEIKSTLTKEEFATSLKTAHRLKELDRHFVFSFSAGHIPPAIQSYIVAYDGPASMRTVHNWIEPLHRELGIVDPILPTEPVDRIQVPSPSLDGVFVLGRGLLYFDNTPLGFMVDPARRARPDMRWVMADTTHGNLMMLFLALTAASSGIHGSWVNPGHYLRDFEVSGLQFGA
jgi:hypothetical protein